MTENAPSNAYKRAAADECSARSQTPLPTQLRKPLAKRRRLGRTPYCETFFDNGQEVVSKAERNPQLAMGREERGQGARRARDGGQANKASQASRQAGT
jgi:hypothetical protein